MNASRRHDRLGVHSIGEFRMTVPSLPQAEKFYSAFGLRAERDSRSLTLRTHSSDHVWGRLCEGTKKKLDGLTFHCFEDEADELYSHILSRGVERIAPPSPDDATGIWFRDPDGLALQVKAGPKTTTDRSQHRSPELPSDGKRCAPYSGQACPALPQRLSHIARMTSSVPAQLDFYTRVLGLRLSDRSGDAVAFLHAPHGSDHHLVAFMGSTGPALHHLSWDVPTVEDVGLGMRRMHAAGYTTGWGVGRHVLGSNYFYYAQDPWGSWCEFSATMDYIPAEVEWEGLDHPADDSVCLWGPPIESLLFVNSEA
jgi:catechol 2,3-dioxygenase-like lactoylglutathione lyase family enzyme